MSVAAAEVRATLRGDEAVLGRVPARDVARMLTGLETALAAAAYAALRQPRRASTGRHRAAVAAVSRLTFSTVETGSVVTVLALPEQVGATDDTLPVDVDGLAGTAFDLLVRTLDEDDADVDAGVARALADLGDGLGIGDRYDELVVSSSRSGHTLHLERQARARLRRLAERPTTQQPDVLVGSLREADFDKQTARLRTATGETVVVTFPLALEDQVHEALRSHAHFEGVVTYDPITEVARRVHLREVSTTPPLAADGEDFWEPATVAELASTQGVGPASFDGPMIELTDDERRDLGEALVDLHR